jgi:hypothetical protein
MYSTSVMQPTEKKDKLRENLLFLTTSLILLELLFTAKSALGYFRPFELFDLQFTFIAVFAFTTIGDTPLHALEEYRETKKMKLMSGAWLCLLSYASFIKTMYFIMYGIHSIIGAGQQGWADYQG